MNKNKRGQVWSLDLIIAGVIFLIGIVILYVYAINYSPQSKNNLENLLYEGNLASKLILSEDDFGILSDKKINQTKLDDFYNLNYSTKKNQLGLTNNFYFVFENMEIDGAPVNYIGFQNLSSAENLIKITRLSIYENKPVKFEVFVWK